MENQSLYRKTYYATHPASIHGATNEELRERYLIGELFAADELRLVPLVG